MDVSEQLIHDWLLEHRPEGAEHESTSCAFCTTKASKEEENVTDKATFTQEQHDALLASAVDRAVAESNQALDAEVLRLNAQLEEVEKAASEKDERIAELEKNIEDRDEAVRLEALADERVAAVKAVASFTDEQIKTRRESWSRMEETAFAAYLEDIKVAVAVKEEAKEDDSDASDSSFDGTRETAGEEGTEVSVIETFFTEGLSIAAQS